MRRFKWQIDYSFIEKSEDRPKNFSDEKKNFETNLIAAIQLRYKSGISMINQRKLFKILEKLESTLVPTIDLEDAEFDLVKECFENADFPPQFYKMLNQIYDNIEKVEKL